MPTYVVLYHEPGRETSLPRQADAHFDWLFDHGSALWSWATDWLPKPGEQATARATRLPDHRREYLCYEGPLTRERGMVTRVEAGEFEIRRADTDHYEFELRGGRTGMVIIQRMRSGLNDSGEELWYWSFRPVRADAN